MLVFVHERERDRIFYRVAHLLRERVMLTAIRILRLGGFWEHLYAEFIS